MMDKEKLDQAEELLKESGATTVVLLVQDGEFYSSLLNGLGIDIVKLLHVTMRKDGLFGFLVGIALKRYLTDIKPNKNNNNKNNKQHGKQQEN